MFHGTSRMHLLAIDELCQRNTKSKERIMETITLEYLSRKIESLQELTLSVLELLKTEKKNEKRRKEEKEELMEIPPISKTLAASLLLMSPRQLQRVRDRYKFKWVKHGKETHYFLLPILTAIGQFNLTWDPAVFEKIKLSYQNRPRL